MEIIDCTGRIWRGRRGVLLFLYMSMKFALAFASNIELNLMKNLVLQIHSVYFESNYYSEFVFVIHVFLYPLNVFNLLPQTPIFAICS